MSNPPKLKVCHVFAGGDGGRWVYDQLRALQTGHDWEVSVVFGAREGATVDLCRAAGMQVRWLDFRNTGWTSIFTVPWRMVKLAHWMRRQRFDVVQSHVIQSTLFARPAAWLADIPVRLEMVTGPFYMQAPSTRWMEAATAWMETGIIPSCELTAKLYREAGVAERLICPTLYYGPEAERFDPSRTRSAGLRAEFGIDEDAPLIGMVAVFYQKMGEGSFIPPEIHGRHVKGQDHLVRAMHRVLEAYPTARLLLVGKGWGPLGQDAETEIRELVEAEGLGDAVIFCGYRTNVAEIYQDLDVSVQASLNDNLGGTVESLLMAKPTVATRVGGMVDSVIDGKTGVLVNPGDPDDLARGILRLLNDRQAAEAMGQAGRALMLDRFTLATTAPGLAELYRRQRRAARGAWRISATARRLLAALILHPPILGRAMLFDVYGQRSLRALLRRLIRMPETLLRRLARPLVRRLRRLAEAA